MLRELADRIVRFAFDFNHESELAELLADEDEGFIFGEQPNGDNTGEASRASMLAHGSADNVNDIDAAAKDSGDDTERDVSDVHYLEQEMDVQSVVRRFFKDADGEARHSAILLPKQVLVPPIPDSRVAVEKIA